MLSQRFTDALTYASELHANQKRKGSGVPYVSHLLGVTSIVLDAGGNEDEAIAALLHDAIEDCGGATIRDRIRQRFGDKVAAIVDECTESDVTPKPPWRDRKQAYINSIPHLSSSGRLVGLADKIHNARSIVADYRQLGEAIWQRFKGGRDGTLWYYQSVVAAFRSHDNSPLVEELARTVVDLQKLVAQTENV
ncbi:HD domain-containing protein [Geitlerinema sp. PCC 9228]|uniref:HD domain-containing protein n=1 Tax=Geitlerinema sp. PCC 9228 TaxID=111611 RepID=UPI0008F99CFC|nr:HD domain-containing protein [Geitlerinema sp. PCC 9228]